MQSSDATDSRSNSKFCNYLSCFLKLLDRRNALHIILSTPTLPNMAFVCKTNQITTTHQNNLSGDHTWFFFIPFHFISTVDISGLSRGYQQGDYFKPHTDGSWSGSRITSKGFQSDAYGDRHSQLTFLILLTDSWLGKNGEGSRELLV